jgi:hypothetical protein
VWPFQLPQLLGRQAVNLAWVAREPLALEELFEHAQNQAGLAPLPARRMADCRPDATFCQGSFPTMPLVKHRPHKLATLLEQSCDMGLTVELPR